MMFGDNNPVKHTGVNVLVFMLSIASDPPRARRDETLCAPGSAVEQLKFLNTSPIGILP